MDDTTTTEETITEETTTEVEDTFDVDQSEDIADTFEFDHLDEEPEESTEEVEDISTSEEEEPSVENEEEPSEEVEEEVVEEPSEPIEEVVEEEPEEESVDELAAMRAQIVELSTRLEASNTPTETPAPKKEEKKEEAPVPATVVSTSQDPIEFVKNASELMGLLRSPAKFNEALNVAFSTMRESVMREMPSVLAPAVQSQLKMVNAVNTFYEQNVDLAEFKPYVKVVVGQVQSEDPTQPLETILEKAADRVRETLKLTKEAQTTEVARKTKTTKKPPFATSKTRKPASNSGLTPQQQEIKEIMDI